MAVVQVQPRVELVLRDASNSEASTSVYVRRGISAAAGLSAVADLRSAVIPASGCTPIEGRYVLKFDEHSPANGGGVAADTGVFVFDTATTGQHLIVALPGLNPSVVMTTGPGAGVDIDVTRPAIVALINAIIAGPWCNPFGYAPTALAVAIYQKRPKYAIHFP